MPLHAGEHRAGGWFRAGPRRGARESGGAARGGPGRRRIRLYGLVGVVVCAVVLPFAVASAGPSGDADATVPATVPLLSRGGDGKAPGGAERAPARAAPTRSPLPPGPALAARCGPELTSPAGVEAQTCVLTRGTETWARTYYRNITGSSLEAVLSLLGPEGRSVRIRCAVSAEDEPSTCETPPERTPTGSAGYTAIAEFASRAGYGPLLLRTGSNGSPGSARGTGSSGSESGPESDGAS
ncbi:MULTISPECIES: hypothetical protein [Streptomyces]|uniref:Uncharacterized protein n=1 Tax=Streptomyces lienomycini TaxID=284035 RepID=A0ABV9WYY1_9ACTN|nr:hypothetical protein [Streptomyces lienomycini]